MLMTMIFDGLYSHWNQILPIMRWQLHLIEENVKKNYRTLLDSSSEMIHKLNEKGQIEMSKTKLRKYGFR